MGKVVKDTLSESELKLAIDEMSDADWGRIDMSAKILSKIYQVDYKELQNESILRALDGRRKCPRDVSVAVFLANTMKSIASKLGLLPRKTDALQHNANVDMSDDVNHPDNISTPEKEAMALELLNDVVTLFEGDEEAEMFIMCEQDGMGKSEIKEALDIDTTQYDSIKKRIRRKYNKLSMEVVS